MAEPEITHPHAEELYEGEPIRQFLATNVNDHHRIDSDPGVLARDPELGRGPVQTATVLAPLKLETIDGVLVLRLNTTVIDSVIAGLMAQIAALQADVAFLKLNRFVSLSPLGIRPLSPVVKATPVMTKHP